MGSVGSCYDNAMIESFWSRMQVELLDRRTWRTRVELANAIFEYLEIFHNRQRRHSALGNAYADRVRDSAPVSDGGVMIRKSRLHETLGQARVSTEVSAVQTDARARALMERHTARSRHMPA
ncbi:MAG: transposase [Chloroflexi bacterium]|nr:transposase [Chloroflexota bacterium]